MSGHNKWSKIKHKKAVTDAHKSKVFSKLVKLIQVEAKRSGGDTNDPGLRAVMEKAKKENMPKDNIERAVKAGAGGDSLNMEKITYEAYGPGGVAMLIEVLTDSRNRAVAGVRHVLSKAGLGLATQGAASWAFRKDGVEWKPSTFVEISDEDSEKLYSIIEQLEESDEVQGVFINIKTD